MKGSEYWAILIKFSGLEDIDKLKGEKGFKQGVVWDPKHCVFLSGNDSPEYNSVYLDYLSVYQGEENKVLSLPDMEMRSWWLSLHLNILLVCPSKGEIQHREFSTSWEDTNFGNCFCKMLFQEHRNTWKMSDILEYIHTYTHTHIYIYIGLAGKKIFSFFLLSFFWFLLYFYKEERTLLLLKEIL